MLLTLNHLLYYNSLVNTNALRSDLKFKSGIYVILIVVSGTILYYYIGSAMDIHVRLLEHLATYHKFLSIGSSATKLYTTLAQYDFSTFNIGVLGYLSSGITLAALQSLESSFISQFHTDKMLNTLIPNSQGNFYNPDISMRIKSTDTITGVVVLHQSIRSCARFFKIGPRSIRDCLKRQSNPLYRGYLKFEVI